MYTKVMRNIMMQKKVKFVYNSLSHKKTLYWSKKLHMHKEFFFLKFVRQRETFLKCLGLTLRVFGRFWDTNIFSVWFPIILYSNLEFNCFRFNVKSHCLFVYCFFQQLNQKVKWNRHFTKLRTHLIQ